METLKRFVFDAILAENSLSLLASQGISVRGSLATPVVISVDEVGFSPRILYDAAKMASVFTVFYALRECSS